MAKAKEKNPEALIFLSRYGNVANLVKQARELKLEQPILSTLGIDVKSFVDSLGNLAEGIVFPNSIVSQSPNNPELQAALKKYQEKYNEFMPVYTAEAYDGIKLLDSIERKGIKTSEEIRAALIKVNDFPGLASNITFNKERVIVKDYFLFTIKNGQFVPLENE